MEDTIEFLTAPTTVSFAVNVNAYPMNMVFNGVDGKQLGEFKEKDGLLTFEGNVDEAGKVFVDCFCNLFNERIKQLTASQN